MLKKLVAATALAGIAATAVASTAQASSVVVPPSKADSSIVEIAQADGRFTTLLAAVGCADPAVGAALTSGEQLTVFAPTDDAFMATLGVDAESVCGIDQALLTTVLTYHVTEGRRFSNSVVPRNGVRTIDTLAGISFGVNADKEIIDGNDDTSPSIIIANIPATNGVIHAVDEVLLPINLG